MHKRNCALRVEEALRPKHACISDVKVQLMAVCGCQEARVAALERANQELSWQVAMTAGVKTSGSKDTGMLGRARGLPAYPDAPQSDDPGASLSRPRLHC